MYFMYVYVCMYVRTYGWMLKRDNYMYSVQPPTPLPPVIRGGGT